MAPEWDVIGWLLNPSRGECPASESAYPALRYSSRILFSSVFGLDFGRVGVSDELNLLVHFVSYLHVEDLPECLGKCRY